jgi:hypothetical protein
MGKVAILGCGPAGLLAAHAAAVVEHDVHIFSRRMKSPLPGAQYLHGPIPLITPSTPEDVVTYAFSGSYDDYRKKVYGEREARLPVSPATLDPTHPAWDLRRAYDILWKLYGSSIQDTEIGPQWLSDTLKSGAYDKVFSTIPLPKLCADDGHSFTVCPVWVAQYTVGVPAMTVQCNGNKEPSWYRAANIFGEQTVEWPEQSRPPIQVHRVEKPIRTSCTCWPNVVRLGRYGEFTKGVLTHDVFKKAEAECGTF